MNARDYLIWNNGGTPICTFSEINQHKHFCVDISFREDKKALDFVKKSLDKLFWSRKKVLVINRKKNQDFQTFFKEYNITHQQFFYKLIGILNYEFSERSLFMKTNKEVLNELLYYENHEKPLLQAIAEYKQIISLKESGILKKRKGELNSISIEFSHISKTFKIEKQSVLTSVMNCLLKYYQPSISVNFDQFQTFKKSILKCLFDFFRTPGNIYYYGKRQSDVLRLLESLFELLDFEYHSDTIKKQLQRIGT